MPIATVDLITRADGGSYTLVGGSVALDFVNLVSCRGGRRVHDWLIPARNADRWAAALDLPGSGTTAGQDLRDLRERIARVFFAIVDRSAPDEDDLAQIGALATEALARRVLSVREDGFAWIDPRPTLMGVLALDASRLLTETTSLVRLRACPGCRRLFLDTTRNRSRRWCDPDECGNRERQRRHYRGARAAER
jgi:predicted RNA-binding Zn ribbon-like protein